MGMEEVLAAWRANNAINLELMDLVADEDMELKPGKGKTIRSNFVHIIGVRRFHLEEQMRKEAAMIPKLNWKTASREDLREGLALTHDLVAQALQKMAETG